MERKCVYLDYNGTTPVYPSVLDAMLPYMKEHFGNPSSSHYFGQEPKRAVEKARESVLRLIQPANIDGSNHGAAADDIDPSSIIFTGCGTESNNLAIRLALLSCKHKTTDDEGLLHVVTTNIEHPAIEQCLNSYAAEKGRGLTPKISVTYVPVNREGIVSTMDVMNAIRPNTALVTIMTANNEVGAIQPVFEIAQQCRDRHILFLTDAAQAVGKMDLRGLAHPKLGADMVTIVGHKFGAPKGVAALYIRTNCFTEYGRVNPEGSVLLMGGGQEGGRRGGTENVPYIVGMGRAADMLFEKRKSQAGFLDGWKYNSIHMEKMRERLFRNLVKGLVIAKSGAFAMVRTNGPSNPRQHLPNTLSVGLKGVRSFELVANIASKVACSTGSSCHCISASKYEYSSVLKALDVPPEYAIGTLRLSVGPDTTEEDVDYAAEIIVKEANRQLRS